VAHEPEIIGIGVFLPSPGISGADTKHHGNIGLRENLDRWCRLREHLVDVVAFHYVPELPTNGPGNEQQNRQWETHFYRLSIYGSVRQS